MIINKRIKDTLSEISKESVKLHNDPEKHTKYIKRMMQVFHTHLTDEERVYVVAYLLELLHYRTLAIDPDNMLTISNIRIRTLFFVFVSTVVTMFIAAYLFKTNSSVVHIGEFLFKFLMIFKI